MALTHRSKNDKNNLNINLSLYSDVIDNARLHMDKLQKKITKLTLKQALKKALLNASENDSHYININPFRWKHFVSHTLQTNPEYFDFSRIDYIPTKQSVKYNPEEPLVKKTPLIH